MNAPRLRPYRSLYVHTPFCAKKCDYCAFYSFAGADAATRARYLSRLERELTALAPLCEALQTLYVGGGTPSHFTADELERLLTALGSIPRQHNYEFTMEANPLSLTTDKLQLLVEHGVSRVSLGVQSFSPETRQRIGRPGPIDAIFRAADAIHEHPQLAFNCDLIYGVPGQQMADWTSDLQQICELKPDHLSAYSLMIEPGTALADNGGKEGDEALAVSMWTATGEVLGERLGLQRYEISNYARPNHQCQHNVLIWRGQAFAGAGPAACYFDGVTRWSNPADLDAWIDGSEPTADPLAPLDRALEILVTGLRLEWGWHRADFQEQTGFDYVDLRGPQISQLKNDGLLIGDDAQIRLTDRGMMLANYVARELM